MIVRFVIASCWLVTLAACASPPAPPAPPVEIVSCPPVPRPPDRLPDILTVEALKRHDAQTEAARVATVKALEICRAHVTDLQIR
jgi:hypothetical protein